MNRCKRVLDAIVGVGYDREGRMSISTVLRYLFGRQKWSIIILYSTAVR